MSALKVCLPHKRKRGRPRADEPKDMKDFDMALIHEFKRRPAFYDRTHPQYRNREHLDPQWTVLAHTLGYTVPVVKNRMMQLRSRYSLEKRRLEAVKEQCGEDAEVTSPWALYEEMDFLGEHIKGRLPMLKKEGGGDSTMQSSESEDNDDSNVALQNKLVNGFAANQTLPTNSSTPIQQMQVSVNASTTSSNLASTPNNVLYQQQQQIQQQSLSQQQPTQPLQKNHLPSANHNQMHQQQHEHQRDHQQHQRYHHHHHSDDYYSSTNDLTHSIGERRIARHEKVLDLLHSTSSDSKFVAFGQFISSSLIEMQETDALRLVEKFTTELIQTLQTDRSTISSNNSNSLANANNHNNNSNNNINNNSNINNNNNNTNVTHDSI